MSPPIIVKLTGPDQFKELTPGSNIVVSNVVHPWQITELWTDHALALIGISRVEPVEPPAGYIVTGYHFGMSGGKIVQILETIPVPEPPMAPLSRRQFFQILAMNHLITEDEALAAVQHGAIPEQLEQYVEQTYAEYPEMKFGARMLIAGASEFERHHPLTDSFAAFYGMSEEQVDEIWKIGAQL